MQIEKIIENINNRFIFKHSIDGRVIFQLKDDTDEESSWSYFDDYLRKLLHQLETEVREQLFTDEELKIMLLDYQSLISMSKRFPRTVVGNDKAKFELDYSDSIRENILKKLESQPKDKL